MIAYALVELEVLGVAAWNCPACGQRNTKLLERGDNHWIECKPPPESPKGTRAAALLPPKAIVCPGCRNQFRAVPSKS